MEDTEAAFPCIDDDSRSEDRPHQIPCLKERRRRDYRSRDRLICIGCVEFNYLLSHGRS